MAAPSPVTKDTDLVSFKVLVKGKELDAECQVYSIEVEKEVNKIPMAKVVIVDGVPAKADFPISNKASFAPGTEVEIKAGYHSKDKTIFKGIIVKHSIKARKEKSYLTIECKDKAVKATVDRKNMYYGDAKKGVKDSDVIGKIIGTYGLSKDVEATKSKQKEIYQYYATDWDFILLRAEVNGQIVIVDDGKVTVKKPEVTGSAVLSVSYGDDLIEFDADLDSETQLPASSVQTSAWDMKTQKLKKKTSSKPKVNKQGDLDSAKLSKVMGVKKYDLHSTVPMDDTSLKDWADAQIQKSWLSRIRGTAKFQGSDLAKPGKVIEVGGVGKRFNGNVFVSGIRHEIGEGNWFTEITFGLSDEWFSSNRKIEAPLNAGQLPGIQGLQNAVVKQIDKDPDGETRILVTTPVMQDDSKGIWARLASIYASKEFGVYFIPEVGDEVVIGYLNDDPRYPVILGSLYSSNAKHKPPYTPDKKNTYKAIVTKTKMKIEFNDVDKIIDIWTPAKNQIIISDKGKSITINDQTKNKIVLDTKGITMDSPKDIKINAKGKIDMTAVGAITVSSKQDVKVDGLNVQNTAKVGFTAKGNATAELSASGQTTVKGAMVMIN